MAMPKDVIGYFTPEIALHEDFKVHTYSGGLGFLAGGHAMSAKKLGIPLVAVSILHRQGYYDQQIKDGKMVISYTDRHYPDIFEDTGNVEVPIASTHISVKVWRLKGEQNNSCPVILLDSDIEENDSLRYARLNTLHVYGGSRERGSNDERKIAQYMILGIGGVKALRHLGYNVTLYHMNESHSACAPLYLLDEKLKSGKAFETALNEVRNQVVFTNHTPVEAGNQKFKMEIFRKMLGPDFLSHDLLRRLGTELSIPHIQDYFNMTIAGLKLSRQSNAVSVRHLETTLEQFAYVNKKEMPSIISITNGVNRDYWQLPEFRDAKSPIDMEAAKLKYNRLLLKEISKVCGKYFSENIPTLVWARRFAEYKRAWLLFRDMDWFKALLKSNRIQVIYAGKPHPDDTMMVELFNHILRLSQELPSLVVLPEYDLRLSKVLKAGSHIWLNTPRAPMEASGTSGMGANLNGGINVSTFDGWMCEADPDECFIFGAKDSSGRTYDQDAFDAERLQITLEEVLDFYENDREGWYEMALNAKLEAEEHWTSDRMVREYAEKIYKCNVTW